nr:MetaGeneMark_Unknown Function [uncultured bacterium]
MLAIEPLALPVAASNVPHNVTSPSFAGNYATDMNRLGYLTQAQNDALFNSWARPIVPVAAGIILVLAVLGLLLPTYDLIVPFPVWIVLFVLAFYAYVKIRNLNWLLVGRDMLATRVNIIEGTLRRVAGSQNHDLYTVGTHTFVLPRSFRENQTLPLIVGHRYRVYCLPRTNLTINLEYLGSPDEK